MYLGGKSDDAGGEDDDDAGGEDDDDDSGDSCGGVDGGGAEGEEMSITKEHAIGCTPPPPTLQDCWGALLYSPLLYLN